jgi:8-amino-7-oxononanoate synthase
MTPRARSLSAHLLAQGLNARPISWPTVPKGMDRVRVCLHAGNTRAELDILADGAVAWAARIARAELDEQRRIEDVSDVGFSGGKLLESKL